MHLCAHTNKDCHLLPLWLLTSALQAFVNDPSTSKKTLPHQDLGNFKKLRPFCSNYFTLLLTSQQSLSY